MKIISHRGNLSIKSEYQGIQPLNQEEQDIKENSVEAIKHALELGFDVEIDVWYENEKFWLGHDYAEYPFDSSFFNDDRIWIHAKNYEALSKFNEMDNVPNYFWHQNDDYTLTSSGKIWTYPGKKAGSNSIIVDLQFTNINENVFGICTDNPMAAKEFLYIKKLEKDYGNYVYDCISINDPYKCFWDYVACIKNGETHETLLTNYYL